MNLHENISNGSRVTDRTRFSDRQTDYGRQWQYVSLTLREEGEDIMNGKAHRLVCVIALRRYKVDIVCHDQMLYTGYYM